MFISLLMFYLCFLVHLCSLSPSIALFIVLLICLELFIVSICKSEYIYCFVYIYYVLVNILCYDYPFPVCFSTAIPSGFGGLCKPSMRP